jgi:uncharacterized protein (TIGR02271 family)
LLVFFSQPCSETFKETMMASTVIGFYDSEALARRVAQALKGADFGGNAVDISIKGEGGLVQKLTSAGTPSEDAELYERGLAQGGALVTVTVEESRAASAAEIMQEHDPVYIEALNDWVSKAGAYAASNTTATTAMTNEAGDVIPVVVEQLRVGKREVSRGGVRLRSYVTEIPVEEQIRLRDETIRVERRAVDRPVTNADEVFKERTFEMTETDEEAVVAKEARVVEEVVLSKEVEERVETVREVVRATVVDVETIGSAESQANFSKFDKDFRTHYITASLGDDYSYEQAQPAYRYGFALASDPRYKGRDWNAIEGEVKRDWENNNKGTWEQFKASVRHAWERARG